MRFHWVDRDGGASYETTDTLEVLASVRGHSDMWLVTPGIAAATKALAGRAYADLDTAKQDVEAVVNERFNNRRQP